MKKKVIIGTSLIIVLSLGFGLSLFLISKIETYKKLTHQDVFATQKMRDHYGIGTNRNPADYGYADYKTYAYKSVNDKTKLEAWYVESTSKNADEALLLLHGHMANRIRTLKYLELVRKNGLDAKYSVMIPDLRNSGNSQEAKTAMGYYFAEDIFTTILFVNKTFGIKKFTLYGFSFAGISTLLMLNRKDLMDELKKKGITIQKIIFDSPLVNVKETLIYEGKKQGFPGFILNYGFWAFNMKWDGQPEQYRLHTLYKDKNIPLLILQAKDDPKGLYNTLVKEIKLTNNDAVKVQYFETGEHVKIYQNPKVRDLYTKTVVNFLK